MDNQSAQPRARRKHRSLAQELVAELSQQIRDGMLKRGDKLPTESAIMQTQGVSRTVVREAISRLQASGLVETRRLTVYTDGRGRKPYLYHRARR